ncbi:MAG: glutathione S-transferase family protein [Granulosicoccus sp.]|nr:glutathione S-transferase family protein [Granulosicoccus sp.]
MPLPKLELISSDRCPFVQRSIITLEQKNVPYTITYVDPYDPPEWFPAVSPLGKVPVLRINDDTILFESAVINEYLDDISDGQLHPVDPLKRAMNKSWIEFGAGCLSATFQLMAVSTQAEFDGVVSELRASLDRLEAVCSEGPYFNGADFSLVDAAYSPMFIRFALLQEMIGLDVLEGLPKMQTWQKNLLALPSVQVANTAILPTRFRELMAEKNAWAATRLVA